MGEAATAGAAGDAPLSCDPTAPPQKCDGFSLPALGVLVDFSTYHSDTFGGGDAGAIRGHTTFFGTSTAPRLELKSVSGDLQVSGTVSAGAEAGWTFWFDQCIDAAPYGALESGASGALGHLRLSVLIETNDDFPIDPVAGRGACHYQSCESAASDCRAPEAEVPCDVDCGTEYVWQNFIGGKPQDSLTGKGILGVGLRLQCSDPKHDCPVDLKFFDQLAIFDLAS